MSKPIAFAIIIHALIMASSLASADSTAGRCVGPCNAPTTAPAASTYGRQEFVGRNVEHFLGEIHGAVSTASAPVPDAVPQESPPAALKVVVPAGPAAQSESNQPGAHACGTRVVEEDAGTARPDCTPPVKAGALDRLPAALAGQNTDEHKTYILLLAGLGLMGTIAHRRRAPYSE